MNSIREFMELHHKRCDEKFAAAEDNVHRRDWRAAERDFAAFAEAIDAHFRTEEDVLFPAYESRSGFAGGPTEVMCIEHAQIRGLLQQMRTGIEVHDAAAFGGSAETLLILLQQHNMKEENILYPMCDQALRGDGELRGLIEQMLRESVA